MHDLRERLALDPFQDVAGEVDAQVRVASPVPTGKRNQVREMLRTCGRSRRGPGRCCCPGRLVVEPGGVAQQHPKGDLPLRMLLEGAVHGELGEIARDGGVQVQPARLHPCITAVAVNSFDIDWTLKIGVDGHRGAVVVPRAEALPPTATDRRRPAPQPGREHPAPS